MKMLRFSPSLTLFLLLLIAGLNVLAKATPGDLDVSFGSGGMTTTAVTSGGVDGIAIQTDGKVLVVGHSYVDIYHANDFLLMRYDASGVLDASFNGSGKVLTDVGGFDFDGQGDFGRCIAVQNNGKIVVGGYSRVGGTASHGGTDGLALVRYNADGSLDTSFNGSGKVVTKITSGDDQARALAIQSDGKIVVAASTGSEALVVRYNEDGSLDTSFNGSGFRLISDQSGRADCEGIAIQSDGKILLSGSIDFGYATDIALYRVKSDGNLDADFNGIGKVITSLVDISEYFDVGNSVAIQNDGKIVVVGGGGLARFNLDGSLDSAFNGTGKVVDGAPVTSTGERAKIVVQSDDKIVFLRRGTISRYNGNGSIDATFGNGGRVVSATGVNSLSLQTDGRIVVAGSSGNNFVVARYEGGSAATSSPPTLSTPGSGSTWTNSLQISFYVPASAVPGSVLLTFSGPVTRVFTLKSSYESPGLHAFTLNALSVGSSGDIVDPMPIPDGNYTVTISYRDATGLPAASSVPAANVTINIDTEEDGIFDRYETGTGVYVSSTDTGTNAIIADSDGDGLGDGQEVNRHHSNPNIADTDGDGFDDGFEVSTGFNPAAADSTPDAKSSIRNAVEYRFNAASGISYRIEGSSDLNVWSTIEANIVGNGGAITRFYSIEGQPNRFFRARRN